MLYSKWLAEWFDNYVRPTVKTKTCVCYKSIINNHIIENLGNYELSELTPLIIQKTITEFLNKGNKKTGRGLSSNTVNLIITIIQSSLEMAATLGLVKQYTGNKIKRPKIKERKVVSFSTIEQKQIETFILKNKKKQMFGILLCLYTGLRIGELLALEWSDIDFKKQELYVNKSCCDGINMDGTFGRITNSPKTETSERIIPLAKQLIPYLKEVKIKSNSNYVVANGSNPISVRSYQRSFELLLKRLGISHKGFHALRHTFATRAIENGMDVKSLSEILGHKNPSITLTRYAHSFMDHKKLMINKLGANL